MAKGLYHQERPARVTTNNGTEREHETFAAARGQLFLAHEPCNNVPTSLLRNLSTGRRFVLGAALLTAVSCAGHRYTGRGSSLCVQLLKKKKI